jgi:hypothetical protein
MPPRPANLPPVRKLNGKDYLVIAAAVSVVAAAYFTWSWAGVALAFGAGLMWALLHFTRMMITLRKAMRRPKGWVSSAIMLNSRLQTGLTMLQVVQLVGAFGDCLQPESLESQEELWRWTDEGGDAVDVRFKKSKVLAFALVRNLVQKQESAESAATAAPVVASAAPPADSPPSQT